MDIPLISFPNKIPQGREYEIISTMTIINGRLVENYFRDHKTNILTNWCLNDQNGNPIEFDKKDYEWLSPTFIRNKDELYGFSLIEKSKSIKLFLTRIRTKVDFKSFKCIGRFYAKDNNHFYFGPGGRIIKEDYLDLFFDETYKEEWVKLNPELNNSNLISLWNSKIAVSGEKIYWKGRLAKGVHSSLKRITQFYWADNYSVFEYDLQNLKKINGIDRNSLIYKNIVIGNSLKGFVTDKYKPAYCYSDDSEPNEKYDFEWFTPIFEAKRKTLGKDYLWYKMEDSLQKRQ